MQIHGKADGGSCGLLAGDRSQRYGSFDVPFVDGHRSIFHGGHRRRDLRQHRQPIQKVICITMRSTGGFDPDAFLSEEQMMSFIWQIQ